MLIHRALRAVHRGYPLTIFWLYVGGFLFSLPFLFILPQVTLILLGLALAGLVWVMLGEHLLRWMERSTARYALYHGACPYCGRRMSARPDPAAPWACDTCRHAYLPSGAEVAEEHPTPDSPSGA